MTTTTRSGRPPSRCRDVRRNRRRHVGPGARWLPAAYLTVPMLVLLLLFVVPMVLASTDQRRHGYQRCGVRVVPQQLYVAAHRQPLSLGRGDNGVHRNVRHGCAVADRCAARVCHGFQSRAVRIPLLLGIVVLDELNPVVRIYAWRMLLGRNGILNGTLDHSGSSTNPLMRCCSTKPL